jgi:hypothetical protein
MMEALLSIPDLLANYLMGLELHLGINLNTVLVPLSDFIRSFLKERLISSFLTMLFGKKI